MAKTAGKTAVAVSPLTGATIPLGAHPGNTGGKPGRSGRPKDKVRAALALAGAKRISVLRSIADGQDPDAKPGDRIKAVDVMLKYGLGVEHPISHDDIRGRLRATIDLIRRDLPPDVADPLLAKMSELWS